jgi:predicted nuclease of restriction endonuclease-like (RecB) superfamily
MSKKKPTPRSVVRVEQPADAQSLLADLRALIDGTRAQVAQAVNAGLTLMYWAVGDRIRREILGEKRAGYGEQIVATLSRQLTAEYGRGFTIKAIWRMIRFAEAFPNRPIVQTLSAQLGWSHFIELIGFDNPLKRDFYAEMCRVERWSVRTLRERIGGQMFERTAIAKKPDQQIREELNRLRDEGRLTPDLVFRDPYVLDFLGLKDTYSEADLEAGILREMEASLLELGAGFTFVARQKRITVDGVDFYLDLLFYHRRLRRLVAIDLKLDKFEPAHKGQMELDLRWLECYETEPGEGTPLGLILCAGRSTEQIELLRLEESGIRVAEYLTELPPRAVLERKLHQAIELARRQVPRLVIKE